MQTEELTKSKASGQISKHNRASQCNILQAPSAETKQTVPEKPKIERKSEMGPQIEKIVDNISTKTADKRYSLDQNQNLFIHQKAGEHTISKTASMEMIGINETSSEDSDDKNQSPTLETTKSESKFFRSKTLSNLSNKIKNNLKTKSNSPMKSKKENNGKRKDSSDKSISSPTTKPMNNKSESNSITSNSPRILNESPRLEHKNSFKIDSSAELTHSPKIDHSPELKPILNEVNSKPVTKSVGSEFKLDSSKVAISNPTSNIETVKKDTIQVKSDEPNSSRGKNLRIQKIKQDSKYYNTFSGPLSKSFEKKTNNDTMIDGSNQNTGDSNNDVPNTQRSGNFSLRLESTENRKNEEEESPIKDSPIKSLLNKLRNPLRKKKKIVEQNPIVIDDETEELINAIAETKLTPRKGAALKISILKLLKYPTLLYKLGGYLDIGFNQSFDEFVAEYNQVSVKGFGYTKIPDPEDEKREYKMYKRMIKSRNQGFKQSKFPPPTFYLPKKYDFKMPQKIFQSVIKRDRSEGRNLPDILNTEGNDTDKYIPQSNRSFSLPHIEKDEAMIQNFYLLIKKNPTHIAESMKLLRETLEVKETDKEENDPYNKNLKANFIKTSQAINSYGDFKKFFRELMTNHNTCAPNCKHIDEFYEKLLYSQKNVFSQTSYPGTKGSKEKQNVPKFKLFELKRFNEKIKMQNKFQPSPSYTQELEYSISETKSKASTWKDLRYSTLKGNTDNDDSNTKYRNNYTSEKDEKNVDPSVYKDAIKSLRDELTKLRGGNPNQADSSNFNETKVSDTKFSSKKEKDRYKDTIKSETSVDYPKKSFELSEKLKIQTGQIQREKVISPKIYKSPNEKDEIDRSYHNDNNSRYSAKSFERNSERNLVNIEQQIENIERDLESHDQSLIRNKELNHKNSVQSAEYDLKNENFEISEPSTQKKIFKESFENKKERIMREEENIEYEKSKKRLERKTLQQNYRENTLKHGDANTNNDYAKSKELEDLYLETQINRLRAENDKLNSQLEDILNSKQNTEFHKSTKVWKSEEVFESAEEMARYRNSMNSFSNLRKLHSDRDQEIRETAERARIKLRKKLEENSKKLNHKLDSNSISKFEFQKSVKITSSKRAQKEANYLLSLGKPTKYRSDQNINNLIWRNMD